MEEKRKGRPRKNPQVKSAELYRSDPEDLKKIKEERLDRMKKVLRGDCGATFGKPDHGVAWGKPDSGVTGNITDEAQADLRVGAVSTEDAGFPEKEAQAIKSSFEEPFTSLGKNNLDFEKLTYAQIEALGKVCSTDEALEMMLASLEESGANQRWLSAARVSFQCAMMEIYRAILKPKGC